MYLSVSVYLQGAGVSEAELRESANPVQKKAGLYVCSSVHITKEGGEDHGLDLGQRDGLQGRRARDEQLEEEVLAARGEDRGVRVERSGGRADQEGHAVELGQVDERLEIEFQRVGICGGGQRRGRGGDELTLVELVDDLERVSTSSQSGKAR